MTRQAVLPVTQESAVFGFARRRVADAVRLAFRVRIVGLDRLPASGPVLLAGNHTGFLDGPIVLILLPRPSVFLVKSELYGGPWTPVLNWARQIPVHRGRPDRTALGRGVDVLAQGGVLGVFPEGTRGTGTLESVQHGIGYLALKAGCPILPVAVLGGADALPKGGLLPRFGARIDIVFGEPFHLDVDGDARARRTIGLAAEQIRLRLVAHLAAARRQTGRAAAPEGPPGEAGKPGDDRLRA
jgi:1-acyl-sn-glycerol-3-phosphate acyltransferase